MLRVGDLEYRRLYLIGAAVLLFLVHTSVFLVVYLGVNGLILVSAIFF